MLLRASLRRCTASTLDLVRREPFKSALVVTTVKTIAADLLVQLAVQKQEWDPRRTAHGRPRSDLAFLQRFAPDMECR